MANREGLADVWVFADGQLEYRRLGLQQKDGPIRLDVQLGPSDRFLTLVSTDGDRTNRCDWVVFGDPVLHVALTPEEK